MLHLLALGVALIGPVPDAIERSIQERMGEVRVEVRELSGARGRGDEGAKVRCEGPEVRCEGPKVIPVPGSRLGRPIRFIVFENGARVGSVVAKLDVTGSVVRSSRGRARGGAVGPGAGVVGVLGLRKNLHDRLPTALRSCCAGTSRSGCRSRPASSCSAARTPAVRRGPG